MEGGDNIQVYARIRPHANGAKIAVTANSQNKEICVAGGQSFVFDHAAGPATTQEEVFDAIGLPIARACLDGLVVCHCGLFYLSHLHPTPLQN